MRLKFACLLFLAALAAGLPSCSSVSTPGPRPITTGKLAARLAQRFPAPYFLTGTFSVTDAKGRPVEVSLGGEWSTTAKVSMRGTEVTVRPGQKAKIEFIHEFVYPSETEPPVIEGDMTAVPAMPKALATKALGWEIDNVRMTTQGGFIVVSGTFRETVFAGFQRAEGALFSPNANSAGQILTDNRRENPCFVTRETIFHAALLPGETGQAALPLASGPAFLRISAKAINPKDRKEIRPVP